jgi:hypothetical protein
VAQVSYLEVKSFYSERCLLFIIVNKQHTHPLTHTSPLPPTLNTHALTQTLNAHQGLASSVSIDVNYWRAPTNGYRETHNIHLENERGKAFQWGSGGWGGKGLRTTRNIAQISLGIVFNVSFHMYESFCGSDCMYAQFFHECCGM